MPDTDITCPTCGRAVDPAWNFCDSCAAPLTGPARTSEPVASSAVTCPSCGATVSPAWNFCDSCAAPLTGDRVPFAPPPSPDPRPPAPAIPAGGYPSYGGYPVMLAARTSGMAIASLVLGIVWVGGLGSILALIFGYIARREIRESRGSVQGQGMATAGVVLGWIGLVGLIAYIIVLVALAHAVNNLNNYTPTTTCYGC